MTDNPLADWLREQDGSASGPGRGSAGTLTPSDDRGAPGTTPSGDLGPAGTALSGASTPLWPSWADDPATPPQPGGWPDDFGDRDPPRRRRTALFVLAAAPWLVIGVLALVLADPEGAGGDPDGAGVHTAAPDAAGTGGDSDAAGTSTAAPDAADHGPEAPAEPTDGIGPEDGDAGEAADPVDAPGAAGAGAGRAAADGPAPASGGRDVAAGAVAALAVRTSLTGDTGDDAASGPVRYVDVVVPESVSWRDDVGVVTVAAVVLDGTAEHWTQVRPARFAVPVTVEDGAAAPAGPPWPLPSPRPPAELDWTPVTDGELTGPAAAALAGAGYEDIATPALERSAQAPGILRARAVALGPGEPEPAEHHVWLSDEPAPTVLGLQSPPGG